MPAENKIRVTAIQRLCVHDGPGVRTTVFLKGCYLQCPWCCNPETIRYGEDALYNKGVCKKDKSSIICRHCVLIGGTRSKEECPINAYEKTYTDYDIDELFALLMRDKSLYEKGGGITFSGGEPLYQGTPLLPLLQKLKAEGVHIAMETSLYVPYENICLLEPYTDYWLIDLKFQYGYIANKDAASVDIDIEKNLAYIQSMVTSDSIRYRMVVMEEIVGKMPSIAQRLKFHHVNDIELLAYHYLGKNKYKELNRPFRQFGTVTKNELEKCVALLNNYGVDTHCMTI